MEIAPPGGSCRHHGSQRCCDCAAIHREPRTTLFLTFEHVLTFPLPQVSFALGTPIPLFLEIFNDWAAHFDFDSIDVRLVRTLATQSVAGGVRKLDVARAAFWPAPGCTPRRIKLWGEVIAGRSLTPTFVFSKCSVRVNTLSTYLCMSGDDELMACDSTPSCFILGIHPNKPHLSRCWRRRFS